MAWIILLAGLLLAGLSAPAAAQVEYDSGSITIIWEQVFCEEPMIESNGVCERPECPSGTVMRGDSCVTPPKIAISPSELPSGMFDAAYPSTQFVGNDGTAPYTFVVAGKLPPGLTLTPQGLLSGVPMEDGAFPFTVGILDANKFEGSRNYSITITTYNAPGTAGPAPCPAGTVRFGANCVIDDEGGGQPPVAQTPPPVQTVDLSYPLQVELNRIGCYRGGLDGDFGRGSQAALAKFARKAGGGLNRNQPTQAALNAARSKGAGFCPPPEKRVVKKKPKKKKKVTRTYPQQQAPPRQQGPSAEDWGIAIGTVLNEVLKDQDNDGGGYDDGGGNQDCYYDDETLEQVCR